MELSHLLCCGTGAEVPSLTHRLCPPHPGVFSAFFTPSSSPVRRWQRVLVHFTVLAVMLLVCIWCVQPDAYCHHDSHALRQREGGTTRSAIPLQRILSPQGALAERDVVLRRPASRARLQWGSRRALPWVHWVRRPAARCHRLGPRSAPLAEMRIRQAMVPDMSMSLDSCRPHSCLRGGCSAGD